MIGKCRFSLVVGTLLLLISVAFFPCFAPTPAPMARTAVSDSGHTEPEWEVGDSWTYALDEVVLHQEGEGDRVDIHLRIGDLTFEVVDDHGDFYQVAGTGKVYGDWQAVFEDYQVNVWGQLADIFPTTIESQTLRRKSDLSIADSDLFLSGRMKLKLEDNPFFSFPLPAIPLPFTIHLDTTWESPLVLFDFPLETHKTWDLISTRLTCDGSITSLWLRVANVINALVTMFGVSLIPEEFAELLPVLEVDEILALAGLENGIEIPDIPFAFICLSREEVTVAAGTFDAYRIMFLGGVGTIYYAPDIAKIVKVWLDGSLISAALTHLYGTNLALSDLSFHLKEIG